MKKTAVKKTVKNKARSKALSAAAKRKATALARKGIKIKRTHPKVKSTAAKKRTLSLHDPHVATANWKDRLLKLGRNAPKPEKPRLELDKYLHCPDELATPAVVDFASEVLSWPMYGNDQIGDCDPAMHAHAVEAWTRYTGTEVDIPEQAVIELYSAISGYDPSTGANDDGCVMQDVLTYLRKNGFPGSGHKILAFAQLKDLSRVHDALWMFGSIMLGINCPQSALDQFDNDEPWSVVPGSPIAGGHAVPLQLSAPTIRGVPQYQVVTWGRLQGMTQAFLDAYAEEAWVVITDDWLDRNGHTPEGLNLQQLGADLAALTGDPNPFPAPVPPAPVPAPVPAPPAPDLQAVEADLKQLEVDFVKTIQDVEKVL